MYRLGVDVGGTFTDLVIQNAETGLIRTVKVPSTPHDPSEAVLDALRQAADFNAIGIDLGDASQLIHSTTVASNTVLQGAGARTGLLVTEGFRDLLEIPPPQALRAVRRQVPQAAPADRAAADHRHPRTRRRARQRDRAARRTGGARRARLLRRGAGGGGRDRVPVQLPQRQPRAPRGGARPRDAARRVRVALQRRLSAVSRVRAYQHDRGERLPGPARVALYRPPVGRSACARRRGAARADAVERRRDRGERSEPVPVPHRRVRGRRPA